MPGRGTGGPAVDQRRGAGEIGEVARRPGLDRLMGQVAGGGDDQPIRPIARAEKIDEGVAGNDCTVALVPHTGRPSGWPGQ